MQTNYRFTNLCGQVYTRGPIEFTPNSDTLLSPVGNRITAFNLQTGASYTLPFETRKDISRFALSPDGKTLIAVDEEGLAVFVNYVRRIVLAVFRFSGKVHAIKFSPNGKYFAVGVDKVVQIWRTPSLVKEFAPFILHRELPSHYDRITTIDWSDDGKWILTGSRDMTVRLRSARTSRLERMLARKQQSEMNENSDDTREDVLDIDPSALRDPKGDDRGLIPFTLAGHKSFIVGAFFARPNTTVFTVSQDGSLFVWTYEVDKRTAKQNIKVEVKRESQSDEDNAQNDSNDNMDEDIKENFDIRDDHDYDDEDDEDEDEDEDEDNEDNEDAENEEEKQEDGEEKEKEMEIIEPQAKRIKTKAVKPPRPGSECNLFRVKGGRWILKARHYFSQNARVRCCQLHKPSSLLVVGFDNGIFGLYDLSMGGFQHLQRLSVSSTRITSVAINHTGEWLGFASSHLGQLLVWEWQSEKYVLKQQGHQDALNAVAYSPEGQYIATGGQDGKLKIWNASTGLCFVTFKEHTGPITGVTFSQKGQSVFSCSLDGTVRAFDLIRYRNFRVFTAPTPTQFRCVALDPSGEIVAAGSADDFSVYIWSVATGKILDILEGHEGPVAALQFSPTHPQLATASWDKTVRIWDIYSGAKNAAETLHHSSDLTALAYRPDGMQLCVASLDGTLSFWNPQEGTLDLTIDGRKDIMGGRAPGDARTALNDSRSRYFTGADGRCILGCGNSRFVCIYEIENRILLRKFQLSHNRSVEGVIDYLDPRLQHLEELENYDSEDDDDMEDRETLRRYNTLPGVQSGVYSKRRASRRIRSTGIAFAPSGRQWSVSTSIGLLIYSLDDQMNFDPFMLDVNVTPDAILNALKTEKNYLKALILSLRLNEQKIIKKVFLSIPPNQVKLLCQQIHPNYIQRLLNFIANELEGSPHLEYILSWCTHLFTSHGQYFKERSTELISTMRNLQKSALKHMQTLAGLCDENQYLLSYFTTIGAHQKSLSSTTNE